jgi:hypothetical protein
MSSTATSRPLRWSARPAIVHRSRPIVLAAVATAALALPAVAHAAPPTRTRVVDFTGTSVLTDLCAFPVTVIGTSNGTVTDFYDENGNVTRTQIRDFEQDTFSANGKTLPGVPYAFSVEWRYDNSGQVVDVAASGLVEKVPLPDGTMFVSAGRVTLTSGEEPFLLVPEVGRSGDISALCSALSP